MRKLLCSCSCISAMMIFDLVGDYRNLESTVSLANLWGFGGEVFCEKCTFPQRIVDFLVVEETTRQPNHQFWEGQVSWSNLLHLTQKLEHVYSGILKDDMSRSLAGNCLWGSEKSSFPPRNDFTYMLLRVLGHTNFCLHGFDWLMQVWLTLYVATDGFSF